MDDLDSGFEDLLAMVKQVNDGFEDELRAVLAKGISLYEADDEGNVYEIAPGGRQFLIEMQGDTLVRIRAAGYHPEFTTQP